MSDQTAQRIVARQMRLGDNLLYTPANLTSSDPLEDSIMDVQAE